MVVTDSSGKMVRSLVIIVERMVIVVHLPVSLLTLKSRFSRVRHFEKSGIAPGKNEKNKKNQVLRFLAVVVVVVSLTFNALIKSYEFC